MINVSPQANSTNHSWRVMASRVVEELFPVTSQDSWDELLELRGLLISGNDWSEVLECFLGCRRRLEEDHYLPFYRLRKILVAHLQLESSEVSLAILLRKRDFSFRRWQQMARKKGNAPRVLEEVSPALSGQA